MSGDKAREPRAWTIARAHCLLSDGDEEAAFALVAPLLAGLRPENTEPDLEVAAAAVVYARSGSDPSDDARCLAWAEYAYNTNRQLINRLHPRTVRAQAALAEVVESLAVGQPDLYRRAASMYHVLADTYEQLAMVDAEQARLRQASCLHGGGGCGEAIRLAGRLWRRWSDTPTSNVGLGCEIAATYSVMLHACNRMTEAFDVEIEACRVLPDRYGPGSVMFNIAAGGIDSEVHASVCARRLTLEEL